jgi:hypothetical protein
VHIVVPRGVVSMSIFIKQMILTKLRQITPNEILEYSTKYGFQVTRQQAEQISNYVRSKRINPFDKKEREKMLLDLSEITDQQTAMKANQLFHELIKSYGLEHLFN